MTKSLRTSIVPTLIIIAGIGVIVAPVVFVLAFWATQRAGLGVSITIGACTVIPAVFAGTIVTLGMLSERRILRYAMSRCTRCGYDLRGTDGMICPECGTLQTRLHDRTHDENP